MFVGPGKRNAHPEADEDTEQLDDVSVGDGVQASEQGVEDGDAGAEDDGRAVVHVYDDGQRGACTDRLTFNSRTLSYLMSGSDSQTRNLIFVSRTL